PMLVMIYLAMYRLVRFAGANPTTAALLAAATALSKPFIQQTILAKDDIQATAFFLTAAVAILTASQHDPLNPCRIGIALGLCFATKFSVLLSAPILLLLLVHRGSLPRIFLTGAIAVELAAPWYLRNIILTDNPIFPVRLAALPGLFTPARANEL